MSSSSIRFFSTASWIELRHELALIVGRRPDGQYLRHAASLSLLAERA